MPIIFPDTVKPANTTYPIVESTDLKGTAYIIGQISETGSIAVSKRQQGMIVFTTSSQQFYGFYGQTTGSIDWDSTLNWRPLSTFSGSYTGSFSGTSSYSNQALSSSYALTASFALNGGGTTVDTGSFVTTSSFNNLTSLFNNFTSSYNTGSFTGSFTGNGSGLANIPASGITGLNLSQIATGSITASVSDGTGSFTITSGSTNLLFVSSSGNVGIGTTAPIGLLHLYKAAATTRMVIDGDAGQSKIITYRTAGLQRFGLYVNNTAESGVNAGSDFVVRAYNDAGTLLSTPLFIKRSTGNVGIGTTAPTSRLQVRGSGTTSATTALRVENVNASASIVTLDNGATTLSSLENTTPLTISGYTLTGSNAQPALDITGSWNTTGTPTLIRANVTDTNSNGSSLLVDLRVTNNQIVGITKSGLIIFSGSFGSSGGVIGTIGGALAFYHKNSTAAAYGFEFRNNSGPMSPTTGESGLIVLRTSFSPTSGTATFNALNLSSNIIISQSGGANGITRGLFISPTITAAADFRAIQNTVGNNLLNSTSGNTYIGLSTNTGTARLQVRGSGTTSATTTLLIQNSAATNLLTVLDNGQFTFTSPLISLAASQSAFSISHSISASNQVGGQYYGVNITPTFFSTTASQTETAFRVAATFTGSAAATGGTNIIADFGARSAGSQLTVTDVTSGSIYMVNDVSGLPIIEATSDWTVKMYNFPQTIFEKTGSQVNINGTLRISGSFILPLSQSVSPQIGSAYWSGSLLFVYDGTQYRSSSFA
jgi:hypothetical protein